jgi:hypothetical protein
MQIHNEYTIYRFSIKTENAGTRVNCENLISYGSKPCYRNMEV